MYEKSVHGTEKNSYLIANKKIKVQSMNNDSY